jgi:hypothetical protein
MSDVEALPAGAWRRLPDGTTIRGQVIPAGTLAWLVESKGKRGTPATWQELHRRYLDWTAGQFDWQWLMADFIPRISNAANCQCRANFRQWVFDHNVDWRNPFAWSVAAHNAVNLRLGKPLLSVDAARAYWSLQAADASMEGPPAHHA